MRRMMIAGVSAGLVAAAPALAMQQQSEGAIAGMVRVFGTPVQIVAKGPNGKSIRTRTDADGAYRIEHLPAGSYTVRFKLGCGFVETIGNVVVRNGETAMAAPEGSACITIGMLRIDESKG